MIEIDRNKIYESHGYQFKNFVILTKEEKLMVLGWRNHEKVRSMMVNKDLIAEEDHFRFIESLKNRDDCYYWLVISPAGGYIGVLDILHVDMKNDTGEIGYYLNPDELGMGFEFIIECNYFVYGQLCLGNNLVTINLTNKETLLFYNYLGGCFDGTEQVGDEVFGVNKHANGRYIVDNYDKFSLLDFAKFVKRNRKKVVPHFQNQG